MSLEAYFIGSALAMVAFQLANVFYFLPQLSAKKVRALVKSRSRSGSTETIGVEFYYNGKCYDLLGVDARHSEIDSEWTYVWFSPKRVKLCSSRRPSIRRIAKICLSRGLYLFLALSIPISMGYIK